MGEEKEQRKVCAECGYEIPKSGLIPVELCRSCGWCKCGCRDSEYVPLDKGGVIGVRHERRQVEEGYREEEMDTILSVVREGDEDGKLITKLEPPESWEPGHWGLVLADVVRHVAKMYAEGNSILEYKARMACLHAFQQEMAKPTTEIKGGRVS